jgi:glycerol-3-phosphate dehydrogenase (NAD+)
MSHSRSPPLYAPSWQDIGAEQLGEGTVAFEDPEHASLFSQLFSTPYFHVSTSTDVVGAEVCGMLKNVVALAVGMVQGLGLGMNSQAAIMRVGLNEMRSLAKELYPSVQDATFFESCGVADLMASCMGGRNRKVAYAYTQAVAKGETRTWDELEAQLLNGQKLQGVLSSHEVQQLIAARGLEARFPLLTTINKVVCGVLQPSDVLRFQEAWCEEEEVAAAVPAEQRSTSNIVPRGRRVSRKQQQPGTLVPVAA